MLLPKEILEEFDELMSLGKTEKAIVLLQNALRNRKHLPPSHLRQITLLSGQYHNWEDEKMSGIKQDSAEFNRINRELLVLADNLRDPSAQSQPYQAPPRATPDPFGPAYAHAQRPHPRPAEKKPNNIVKFITWFFIGLGALAFLGLLIELGEEEDPSVNPAPINILPADDPAPTGLPAPAPPPVVEEPLPSMTAAIRERMLSIARSNAELSPDDLLPVNANELSNMFGNTTWFHVNFNQVSFNPSGTQASYLLGNATLQILYKTTYGFYVGQYNEPANGDSGFIAIAPVVGNEPLTVFAESTVHENATAVSELTRQ